jgi:hypothetical protein
MLILVIATTVLALFYGLLWHNQPARERKPASIVLNPKWSLNPKYPPAPNPGHDT